MSRRGALPGAFATRARALLSPKLPAHLETAATTTTTTTTKTPQQPATNNNTFGMASSLDEPPTKQRAAIVGGGPAGALMAVHLSRSGRFQVDIFEALEEDKISGPTIRSWNVVLFGRGTGALEDAGVALQEEAGDSVVLMTGSVRHHNGRTSPFLSGASSICRGDLAKALLDKAGKMPNVTVHYGCTCSGVDMVRRTATFERASGDGVVEHEYDMLVGADGVNSRVRRSLEEGVPEFAVRQQEDHMEFKTISIPIMGMEGADESWKSRFHTTNSKVGCIIGAATQYGTITGAVILPGEGKTTFGALMKTAQDVRDFFGAHYPRAFGRKGPSEEIAKDFLERRPQRLRSTYCSSLSHGNVVLIGDAAHSMWASLGQGVNAALEDCQVFAQVLESATEGKGPDRAVSVPTLLSAYNERRLEDALAAVALSEKGMGGARTSTLRFAATMLVTMTLHKTLGLLAPGVFGPPALMGIGTRPYGEVSRDMKREAAVTKGLLYCSFAVATVWLCGKAGLLANAAYR